MGSKRMNENDLKKIITERSTNIGGPFTTDLENGPKNHGSRALGNWQSDNAWDVFAPAGSIVNSYTNGTVKKVRDTGKNSGKIFGTQVTVSGRDGFPDIFYTHLKDVKLRAGDKVSVGDRIGLISEWIGNDKITHVHIGLPPGNHLRDLLRNSKAIFSGKGGDIKKPSSSSDETSKSTEDEKKDDKSKITDKKTDDKKEDTKKIDLFGFSALDPFIAMARGDKDEIAKELKRLENPLGLAESINEDVVRIKEIMKKVL